MGKESGSQISSCYFISVFFSKKEVSHLHGDKGEIVGSRFEVYCGLWDGKS